MDKKKSERIHSKRRAYERYGVELTSNLRDKLRGKIKRSEGTFLRKQSLRVSIWEVSDGNITYRVAYDKKRSEIITFLTRDYEKETEAR